ncbi:phage tail tape measure protein [Prauserella salsuginis]|uniref:Phage tail tape measure protein n=3 Tax=Prauserella salsuginis group TaxID=2893672 RepID=A0ABW6G5Q8_9PSEU|nr:phage tail tape measure protein [Prauserella salsuginis]
MAALKTAGRQTRDLNDRLVQNRQATEAVGRGLVGFGTAVVGGMALATKAAIDWESAWAGVTKTVDGSESQMAALEARLRDMATELPATHEEIASVAEAAGQLGVQRESVAGFTRTMIDLGNTTNLTAEEAASAMAQFGNVMGTSQDDVDRLGSALVALGNNSATTEADILEMSQRLAGAGNLIGATESDILAMSAALASVGIRAEAGGGSMSRVMQQIHTAVSEGGEAVQGFADVAGMSADEFSNRWSDDPVEAINSFVLGLNNVEASGGNVVGVLSDLGIRSTEDVRTILGLKGATDLLSDSLGIAAEGWEENTALSEEAQQRYDTAASQIQVAWNTIKDAAIDVGAAIMPVVSSVAGTVGDLARAFSSLPDPVKGALGVLGSVAGVASLAAGGLMLMLPRIRDTRDAIRDLGLTGDRAQGRVRRLGRSMRTASVAAAGLGAAAVGIDAIFGSRTLEHNLEALTVGLERWATQSKLSGEAARFLGDNAEDLSSDFEQIGSWANFAARPAQALGETLFGWAGVTSSIGDAEKRVQSLGQALAQLVEEGDADVAAAAFERIAKVAGDAGVSTERVRELMPEYAAALEVAGDEASNSAGKQGEFAEGVGDAKSETEQATDALQEYADQQRAMVDPVFALQNALRRQEEAQQDLDESIRTHGPNSEQARTAQWALAEAISGVEQAALDGDISFDAFKTKLQQWVEQGKINQATADTLKERVKTLREEAEDYRGPYDATFNANTGQAREKIRSLNELLDMWDGKESTAYAKLIPQMLAPDYQGSNTGLYNFNFPGGATGGTITRSGIKRYAGGGTIVGPGTGTSDSIPAFAEGGPLLVSNGEFISTDASRRRNEAALIAGNRGATLVPVGGDGASAVGERDAALQDMRQTLQTVADSEDAWNTALNENSDALERSETLAGSLVDVVTRTGNVAGDSDAAYGRFSTRLTQWDGQARRTQARADALAGRVVNLRGEAEDYQGGYDATLTANTHPAQRAIREGVGVMNDYLDRLNNTTVKIGAQFDFGQSGGGVGSVNVSYGLADGGPVVGPGGPTDDQVPLWGSNGEYMIRAAAVSKYGRGFLDMVNAGKYRDGGLIEPRRRTTYRPSDTFGSALEGGDMLGDLFEATEDILARGASEWASSLVSSAGSGGGAGVARWRSVAARALAYTGSPMSWLPSLMRRMNQESGGNAAAFNDWDINAINGVPSQGLMQTIPPTFYGYAGELAPRGILDPFANIVAAIRYTVDRYGSGPAGWNRPGGYDEGGMASGVGMMAKRTIEPERVLSPRQTASFEQLVRVLDRGGAGGSGRGPQTMRIVSGRLAIEQDRQGGLVAMMRDVVAQELSDERAFRGR